MAAASVLITAAALDLVGRLEGRVGEAAPLADLVRDAPPGSVGFLGAGTTVVLAALAGLCAARLAAPLADLAASLSGRPGVGGAVALHLGAPGEIGVIARAFHALGTDLFESTARIETIYRNAPVGIVSCDVAGRIVDMNPKAEAMFGFGSGGALGRSLDILMPAEYRHGHASRLAAFENHKSDMSADRNVAGLRRDGTRFPLSVALGSVDAGARKTVIGILQDVSERHAAEDRMACLLRELEASKRELERSNGELDQFAYIASHDLKAPLRVIDNASRWLSEDLEGHLTEDTRESMDLLRSRVRRMDRLLDDLLAYSRVGRDTHCGETVCGERILQEVIALASPPTAFRIEIGPGFDKIALPSAPISSVLLNLVSNAIKHHDRLDGRLRVTVEDTGGDYAFCVEDDGPGIPAEYHEKVFGMFQVLKPRDVVEGSGMGLAFVRKTVESVGGSLTLTSADGKGCAFRFTWPKPPGPPDARPPP
ncbi:ATP-binding protein [Roseibacterium sp. SDUM158017]|uniref:sensor histidine kinase n=1 Tax=Roseicyclus salinarum TaxID=3036773 RepID=UPI0024150AC7|nr:ATP-binding protein [Roseibacterium sp. SDUM158017]MDG4647356.1 ATP-binding protein [Roseibacterium sp. SDUM158017]